MGMWSPEAPRGLCDAPGMCSPKENVLLHCYSAGIIQALLSACRGAMTAEITCFHMALSALRRESLALNPLRCLVVYSFFNYTQSQVSTVTQFHFENQWDSTPRAEESFLRTCVAQSPEWVLSWQNRPESNSWAPWGSPHPPSLSHTGTFWSGPSCSHLRKLSALCGKCFQGSDKEGCWPVPGAEEREVEKDGINIRLYLKWCYWKGWTWHPCLIIGCESVIGEKNVKSIKMWSEYKSINENYSHTGY